MSHTKKSRSIKKPVLTAEQLAFRARLDDAQSAIREAEDNYKRLLKTCKSHVFFPMTDELREGLRKHEHWTWKYDSAVCDICDICDKGFGWRCPDSPDTVCHYYTKDTKAGLVVELVDGTEVPYTVEDHSPDHETDDVCLFCGAPEERK